MFIFKARCDAVILRRQGTAHGMDVNPELREHKAIDAVDQRLRRSFADFYSGEAVTHTVREIHHRFDGRPIRDFVPVLVERYAREELCVPADA